MTSTATPIPLRTATATLKATVTLTATPILEFTVTAPSTPTATPSPTPIITDIKKLVFLGVRWTSLIVYVILVVSTYFFNKVAEPWGYYDPDALQALFFWSLAAITLFISIRHASPNGDATVDDLQTIWMVLSVFVAALGGRGFFKIINVIDDRVGGYQLSGPAQKWLSYSFRFSLVAFTLASLYFLFIFYL